MPFADKQVMREYQRRWMAARRAAWFEENGPCAQCGTWDNLRLDHIDPKQKVDHKVWSWSEARRLAELAKCQVLCHPCHVIKTAVDGNPPAGEATWNAKLTDEKVIEIRRRQSNGETKRSLAREYEVDEKLIRLVCKREIWKHI